MADANEKLLKVGVLSSEGARFFVGNRTLLLASNYAGMRPLAGRTFILVLGEFAKETKVKVGKRLRGEP